MTPPTTTIAVYGDSRKTAKCNGPTCGACPDAAMFSKKGRP